ncbi:MAG TPA: DUF503 domain-containing protein [Isosphaeraceae bacterium]|jgi:hypothetical protein
MHVATLRLELQIGDCLTLRQKRRRLRAIIERLHRHFNVSVAEVGRHDRPAEAILGVAAVGGTRRDAREVLGRVADALGAHPRAEVLALVVTDLL